MPTNREVYELIAGGVPPSAWPSRRPERIDTAFLREQERDLPSESEASAIILMLCDEVDRLRQAGVHHHSAACSDRIEHHGTALNIGCPVQRQVEANLAALREQGELQESYVRALEATRDRLVLGFDRIQEKRRRQSDTWRSNDLPDYGRGWHDGYVTAMAECSLIATEATDPEGWTEHEDEWQAATRENDREWFERTGCCGHCGNPAEDCLCTDDDPCACGPHDARRTWPRDCGWCKGTGKVEPRFPGAALAPTEVDEKGER